MSLWISRALLLIGLSLPAQDDPLKRTQSLIEKLQSESAQERDDAVKKLKELGEAAIPELEKASRSSDLEVSSRARYLLIWNEIRKKGAPDLRKIVPDLEDRLAHGNWTEVFLEVWAR